MKKDFRCILIVIAVLLSLLTTNAFACSCIEIRNLTQVFNETDAIFLGSVIQSEVLGNPEEFDTNGLKTLVYRGGRKATFRVVKSWKGPQEEIIAVVTGEGGGDCGFDFIVGHSYLVYAHNINGELSTGICSRTRDVSYNRWIDASDDWKFLNQINNMKGK